MSVNAMFFFMIRCDKICSKRFVENTSQDMVSQYIYDPLP